MWRKRPDSKGFQGTSKITRGVICVIYPCLACLVRVLLLFSMSYIVCVISFKPAFFM